MHYQRKTTKLAMEQSKAGNNINLLKAFLSPAAPTIYATGGVRGNRKIAGDTECFVTSLSFIERQRPWWGSV